MSNTSFKLSWFGVVYKVADMEFKLDGSVNRVKVFQKEEDLRDGLSKWLYPNGKDIFLIESGNF